MDKTQVGHPQVTVTHTNGAAGPVTSPRSSSLTTFITSHVSRVVTSAFEKPTALRTSVPFTHSVGQPRSVIVIASSTLAAVPGAATTRDSGTRPIDSCHCSAVVASS